MLYVPRAAVVIKPKPAFIALVNDYEASRPEPLPLASEDAEGAESFIILLPEFLNHKGARDYLRKHVKSVFRHLLPISVISAITPRHWILQSLNDYSVGSRCRMCVIWRTNNSQKIQWALCRYGSLGISSDSKCRRL